MRTLTLCCLLIVTTILHAEKQHTFTNPVLPGGYPDPSIVRVDDTFYLVNSSFEYFPGLPLHKSKDLVNWTAVGHALHRPEQVIDTVNLVDVQSDGGIHAPSIRYNDGKFYVITTNVYLPPGENQTTEFVNFIVTAEKIEGPWSDPIVINNAPGIDPDIFFDDDGRIWYVGTHSPAKPNFDGEGEIYLQELDPKTYQFVGQRHYLWRGACGGVWAEGPHIYKQDNRYYLMVAEGGTSFNHAVTIAVSDDITGPYISNDRNPILTSRHLSYDNWVSSTGHADLVQLEDGRWFAVMLGIRTDEKRKSNMGRETHIAPVTWEREPYEWKETKYLWPVIAPKTGRVERTNPIIFKGTEQRHSAGFRDDFESYNLDHAWNFRRLPVDDFYKLSNGHLHIKALPQQIKERGRAALLGFRQQESEFSYTAKMSFQAQSTQVEAGISLFQKDNNYLNMTVIKTQTGYDLVLQLAYPKEETKELARKPLANYQGDIQLRVTSKDSQYKYFYSLDEGASWNSLTTTAADLILSLKYTGANLGLYASSNGQPSDTIATFDWIRYQH